MNEMNGDVDAHTEWFGLLVWVGRVRDGKMPLTRRPFEPFKNGLCFCEEGSLKKLIFFLKKIVV